MTTPDASTLSAPANDAYAALKKLALVTRGAQIPAPVGYDLIGDLKLAVFLLPEITENVSRALANSLNKFEVYDAEGVDPVQSIASAADHLLRAASFALQMAEELDRAQSAIRDQGYKVPPEDTV